MTIVNSIIDLQNPMKVQQQQFARGFWDHNILAPCNRPQNDVVPFNLKNFINPTKKNTPQAQVVETHGGGTRWNPTQDQIEILEILYSRGMRTPNSHQIEQIAVQLSRFGKIQPKNVFYWFQNHKARERQKLKRLTPTPTTSMPLNFHTSEESLRTEEEVRSKKKRTSWTFKSLINENRSGGTQNNNQAKEEEHGVQKTLELFPLYPDRK